MAEQNVTPVAWRLEPTPTPRPPTRPSVTPPPPPPRPYPARPAFPQMLPRFDAPPAPRLTPVLEPPLHCQFSDGAVTLQATYRAALGPTPEVAGTMFQAAPGYMIFVAGEPMPGVVVELRLPRTTVVAGAVIQPQIQVHNAGPTSVMVLSGIGAAADGPVEFVRLGQADPRSLPSLGRGRPPGGGPTVPSGQTWSISSFVQLPFDAAKAAHLHARVRLASTPSTGGRLDFISVVADLPLSLTAPTPAQELHLELHADREQWCLRATTGTGSAPAEPLVVRLLVQGAQRARWRAGTTPHAGGAGTWAGRWHFGSVTTHINGVTRKLGDDAFTFSAWVGGPDYVTAVTPQMFVAEP